MKGRFLLLILMLPYLYWAQTLPKSDSISTEDLIIDKGKKDSLQIFKPQFTDYLVFNETGQKKTFDTAFSINNAVKYTQINNKDNFGKISFANHNQALVPLLFQANYQYSHQILPSAKMDFLIPSSEVQYYDVKTPTTTFFYHNAVRNGAVLKSTYTQNFGKNLNIAVDYIGIRSQGAYVRSLSGANKVTLSAHYLKNNYEAFAYYGHHNINNEENGGIKTVDFFLNGDSRFTNRLNFEMNLNASSSHFSSRNYYLSHSLKVPDRWSLPVKLKHVFYVETNKFHFDQTATETYYTSDYFDNALFSNKYSKKWNNNVGLEFNYKKFAIDASVKHQSLSIGTSNAYQSIITDTPNSYTEQRYGIEGHLNWDFNERFKLNSDLEITNGHLLGQHFLSLNNAELQIFNGVKLAAHYHLKSSAPSLNLLFQPSFYKDFSHGLLNFKQETSNQFGGEIQLKYFETKLKADVISVINYAYLDADYQFQQSNEVLNITQLTAESRYAYKNWNLQATLSAQKVLSAASVLPLPQLVARMHLYYQSPAFKKKAQIMTGIRAHFYSKFASRMYFSVANEFALNQTNTSLGGIPIADAYFNLKVKRMMIFAEGQQISNLIKKNQLLLTPNQPSMDFRINLGIVWYLFN